MADPTEDAGLTEAHLAVWERLASSATPGPWRTSSFNANEVVRNFGESWDPRVTLMGGAFCFDNDARFVAASREAVPALVAELRRLRARLEAAERERDDWKRRAEMSPLFTARNKAEAYDRIAAAFKIGACVSNRDRLVSVASSAAQVRDEAQATRDQAVAENIAANARAAEAERLLADANKRIEEIGEASDALQIAVCTGSIETLDTYIKRERLVVIEARNVARAHSNGGGS